MCSQKIAVLKFSALGDIAATLPLLRTIQPKPCIITSPLGHTFLKDEFSDFIIMPDKSVRSHLRLIHAMRQRGFTDIIDLQGNDRCRFLSKVSTIANKTKRHNGYDANSRHQPFSPMAEALWHQAKANQSFKRKPKDYIVLNTGSSAKWIAKRPPKSKWLEFAQILDAKYKLSYKLTGSAEEFDYISDIAESLPFETEVLAGKTSLTELKPLLRGAFLTVSTDSAAMHISAVEGTPTIGIFGSTTQTSIPKVPWAKGLYDTTYYPDGQLPKCTATVDNYYDHIDLNEGLQALDTYLS